MQSYLLFLLPLTALLTSASPISQPLLDGDQCGPTVQIPTDPEDTCTTEPNYKSEAYSIKGLDFKSRQGWDWTVCAPIIEQACTEMADDTKTPAGHWYFYSTPPKYYQQYPDLTIPTTACQLAWYVDAGPDVAPKPAGNCRKILTAMMQRGKDSEQMRYETFTQEVGFSINLKTWPSRQENQWWSASGVINQIDTPVHPNTGESLC